MIAEITALEDPEGQKKTADIQNIRIVLDKQIYFIR